MGDGGCLVVLLISFVYEYAHFGIVIIDVIVVGLFLCIVVVGIRHHGRDGRR